MTLRRDDHQVQKKDSFIALVIDCQRIEEGFYALFK